MIFLRRPHAAHAGYANAKLAMLAMLEAYEESYGLGGPNCVRQPLWAARPVRVSPATSSLPGQEILRCEEERGDGDSLGRRLRAARFSLCQGRRAHRAAVMDAWTARPIWEAAKSIDPRRGRYPRRPCRYGRPGSSGTRQSRTDRATAPMTCRRSAQSVSSRRPIPEGLKETWDWYCAHHG